MYNLLPRPQKKKLLKEYRSRIAVMLCVIMTIIAGTFFASLFPSYFLSLSRERLLNEKLANLNRAASANTEVGHVSFAEVKKLSQVVSAATAGVSAHETLSLITRYASEDVRITGFDVNSAEQAARKVQIVGIADTRDSILAFSKRLEQEKRFKKVDVPV